MADRKQESISYHLDQADESLASAKLWLGANKPNAYFNRLIFSYMYAMWAMLLAEGSKPNNRIDIVRRFRKEFVQAGRIPQGMIESFDNLTKCHKEVGGDFSSMASEKPAEIGSWLADAHDFVNYVRTTLGEIY